MERYKWKWIEVGALVCMNNTDFEKKLVSDNIVLDVCIYAIMCLLFVGNYVYIHTQ